MTSFETVYEQMLVSVEDYQLNSLYSKNYSAFVSMMVDYIKSGIPEFTECLQSLTYSTQKSTNADGQSETLYYFDQDLTPKEISILSKTLLLRWWERHIQTVTSFENKVPLKDFKSMEIANGLKQKSIYKYKLKEEISYDIMQYHMANISSMPFFGGTT